MKRLIFICISLIISSTLFSQTGVTAYHGSNDSWGIQFVPLPLIDRNPKLRLGFEFRPENSFGYSLEIGWANHALKDLPILGSVWGVNYSAFEIRPQAKWYFMQSARFELYLGAELFYRRIKDHLTQGEFKLVETQEYTAYEEADILKEKTGVHFLIGDKLFLGPSLFLEGYLGLGFAYRNHIYSNVINATPSPERVREWFTYSYQIAGKKWVGQLPAGFKIGLLIK